MTIFTLIHSNFKNQLSTQMFHISANCIFMHFCFLCLIFCISVSLYKSATFGQFLLVLSDSKLYSQIGILSLGFSAAAVMIESSHLVRPQFGALSFDLVAVAGGIADDSRSEVSERPVARGVVAGPEGRVGGVAEVRSEPLLRVRGVGPCGVDAHLQSPDGRGRRVT